jgi:AraC family ethanolamine operon transcriptional activator
MNSVQAMQAQFTSAAEFSHVISQVGWPSDFRQLDCGAGGAALKVIKSSGAVVQWVAFDRQMQQRVIPMKGYIDYGLLSTPMSHAKVGRQSLTSEGLLLMHENGFECIADPGFRAITLSFEETQMNELAQNLGLPEPNNFRGSGGLDILPDLKGLAAIRAKLDQLSDFLTDTELAPEQVPALKALLDSELPTSILLATAGAKVVKVVSVRNRELALRRALDYIEASPREALTVEALCKASASSISTLERAFRDRFAMSPKRYILVQRLHGVNEALLYQAGPHRIAEIANDWGFWHMGRFAGNYKALFGCLPSQTIIQTLQHGK